MTDAKTFSTSHPSQIPTSPQNLLPGRLYIVHSPSEARQAGLIATAIAPWIVCQLIPAWPEDVPVGNLHTLEGLAKRLAHGIFDRSPEPPLCLLGLGSAGACVARPLISELLGLNLPIRFAALAPDAAPSDGRDDPAHRHILAMRVSPNSARWTHPIADRLIAHISSPATQDITAWIQAKLAACQSQPCAPLPPSQSVLLRSGKPGDPPVFCIPGAGASIVTFVGLVNAARVETPFYGLQPRGLDESEPPYTDVATAAQAMEELICRSWPRGPVHLVGHSFGGYIAFETAIRLSRRGRFIASLALIDSRPPSRGEWPAEYTDREVAQRWIKLNEQAAETALGISDDDLSISDPQQNMQLIHRAMVRVGLLPPSTSHAMLAGPMRAFAACLRTWYRPSGIDPGPIRLIYLDDPQVGEDENLLAAAAMRDGWAKFGRDVRLLHGSGNHITGLKPPHVAALAGLLSLGDLKHSSRN